MKSIKLKLVLGITGLIVAVMSISAYLLIDQKEIELKNDLFESTNSFAELTADDVVDFYNLYLSEGSYVYFNREIQNLFQRNNDVNFLKLYSYAGNLLFDSDEESERQYQGDVRVISGQQMERVQSQLPSIVTVDSSRVIYLSRDDSGVMRFVDENGSDVEPLGDGDRIGSIVYPVENAFAVEYGVSYDLLNERVAQMQMNIVLLATFAMLLGFGFAYLIATQITRPIKKVTAGAREIATGNFETRITVKTKDETSTLAKTFNQMAETLAITTKAMLYEERVRKELELAAQIQKDILPKSIPKVNGLDVSAGLIPAEEIGGDCYDFIDLGGGQWIFYVGDVTGHGVPSGIVVSIANAMFFRTNGKTDPKEILEDVNYVLKYKTTSNMFLTLLLVHWNENTGKLTYVSAGHEPMLVYRAADKSVEEMQPGGIALGMLPNIEPHLEVKEVALEPGDSVIVYTDGIPEAWRNEKDMYGMERFKKNVAMCGDLGSASAIRNAIFADVREFTGTYKQMDDITAMILKRH